MSASLIRSVASVGLASDGVNLFSIAPPASSVGTVTRTIGIVGDFPWGPPNVPTTCYGPGDVMRTFCPDAFGLLATSEVMKAFIGKDFPGPLVIVRINATSAVAEIRSYTVAGGAFVGTANYKGAAGSLLTLTWAAATDADAAKRNLTVSTAAGYSALYENVTLTSILTLADPYITWTATSTPSALPAAAVAATATTAGSNGTAVAGDYVGSGSSNVGIRRFYSADVDVDVLFVAECPSALIAAVNAGINAYGTGSGKTGMAVLCTVAGQSAATAAAYPATAFNDSGSHVVYAWPKVSVTDSRLATLPTISVDGNAFAAVAMVTVEPWESPEYVLSKPALTAITALEDETMTEAAYTALKAGGVFAFFRDSTLGTILRAGVTTCLTSGQQNIVRSLYRRYAGRKCAELAVQYLGVPLQVDLTNQRLGARVKPLVDSIIAFCIDEETKERIFPIAPAESAFAVDPYSANSAGTIQAGAWEIDVGLSLPPPLRKVIVGLQISSTGLTVVGK